VHLRALFRSLVHCRIFRGVDGVTVYSVVLLIFLHEFSDTSPRIFGNNPNESKLYSGRNKSGLKSGNACYHSVQNLLCSIQKSKD
jgi:hypothetical protein